VPSLVTSVIGGIQSASAAHHAADAISLGYKQAGQTVTDAAAQVNPGILDTAATAGRGVTDAAAAGASGATAAAATGAAGATTAAKQLTDLLNPYISAGATAAGGLTDAAKPFTADMMAKYSPVYQFQLQQGEQAAARQAAAMGVTGSGGTAKALQQYAQQYAGTAFTNASNLYNQNFNRLLSVANLGQGAATTAGEAGVQAAEYGGTLQENAAQYAGNLNTNAAQWAGTANINARDLTSQNTLSAANYLANTQIGAKQAIAQGDLGAASSWNNMLGGIGSTLNQAAMLGFGAGGGWSPSNIGTNLGNFWSGGGGGGGAAAPMMQWPSNYQPIAPTAFPAPQAPQLPSGFNWNSWQGMPNRGPGYWGLQPGPNYGEQ